MLFRHTVAFVSTVTSTAVLSGLAYVGLVVYSVAVAGDMGGPLNFVLVPVLAAASVVIPTLLFAAPIADVSFRVAARWRPFRYLAPLSTTLLGIAAFLWVRPFFMRSVTPAENAVRITVAGLFIGCVAFLVYWPTLLLAAHLDASPKKRPSDA